MSIIEHLNHRERDLFERLHICDAARTLSARLHDLTTDKGKRAFRKVWRSLWEAARDRGLVGEEANPSNWSTKEALA